MIAYLLPEADARPGVKWEEDERVRREVLVQTFVQEPIGIEFKCYTRNGEDSGFIPPKGISLTIRSPVVFAAMHEEYRVRDSVRHRISRVRARRVIGRLTSRPWGRI